MDVKNLAEDAIVKAAAAKRAAAEAGSAQTLEEKVAAKLAVKATKKAADEAQQVAFVAAKHLVALSKDESVDEGQRIAAELTAVDALVLLTGASAVTDSRRISIVLAVDAGVDFPTLRDIITAPRLNRDETIVLPAGRFEGLSRGKGWARQGTGLSARWGEKVSGGYRVGPGKWVVGSTDGFNRKDSVTWDVEHLAVGDQTWTRAS